MIKFIIEKFRSAPGPLKQPRLILADLAEEVLDTAIQYMGHRSGGRGDEAPRWDAGAESPGGSTPPAPMDSIEAIPEPASPTAPVRTLEIDPRLERAMSALANTRKQDFKVLAILWDAHQRGLVPLSAKAVSDHGAQIGLAIRHENVRKVIRMRLEKYVDYQNEGAGNATIYRYALNAAGREHFAGSYLRESAS
jgi:hypothetical protein